MIYFKDDVIEIITSRFKSESDVPNAEIGYYRNQNCDVPFIGQRFIIDFISDWTNCEPQTLYSRNFKCSCEATKCILYKRPFKNHIKHLSILFHQTLNHARRSISHQHRIKTPNH